MTPEESRNLTATPGFDSRAWVENRHPISPEQARHEIASLAVESAIWAAKHQPRHGSQELSVTLKIAANIVDAAASGMDDIPIRFTEN